MIRNGVACPLSYHFAISMRGSNASERSSARTLGLRVTVMDCRTHPALLRSVHGPALLRQRKRHFQKAISYAFLMLFTAGLSPSVFAQESSPFQVSNPKHKKWSSEEADKIYYSACELLARTVRPEKPPRLHPRFLLILGTNNNEVVRTDSAVEIHLKSWDVDRFAEAMVMVAAREVLQRDDLTKIARQSVSFAQRTVSVDHLRENQ